MPSFTGLPPHVSILAQIESLKVALKEAMESIINGVKADLDGRRLGLQSYFDKEEIIQKMGELHSKLLRRVEVVSRRSATMLQAGNDSRLEVAVGGSASVSSLSDSSGAAITLVEQDSGKKYQFIYSPGAISRVPADFIFPKMSLMTLITSWFCGNESMKTIPFKLLRGMEIKNIKERYKHTHMRMLILAVEIAEKRVGTWDALAQRGAWDVGSTVRLYESVQHFFMYPSKMKRWTTQISWQTVYNLFRVHNRVFATDLD
jgi:hypothetical protein